MDYDSDLHAWTQAQADALRRRATNEIDWENLAEEIESVGRSDKREIESRLEILLIHLIKWRYDPDFQCNSWRSSIDEARRRIARILKDSPSLRSYPGEALNDCYRLALLDKAIRGLGYASGLPDACPWLVEQILDPMFFP